MGYDDLKELMDIDFPGEGLSEDEDHTATGTGGTHPSVVPMIDVAVGGWDNDAISQCFSLSLATYHQNDAERVFEPVPNRLLIASTGLIQDLSHEGGGNPHDGDPLVDRSLADPSSLSENVNTGPIPLNTHGTEAEQRQDHIARTGENGLALPNWAL